MKPLSPEWHEARKGLLTASDFAAACGLNPYCSRQELWDKKVNNLVVPVNHSIQWGQEHEKDAISAYEVVTGSLVAPVGLCSSTCYTGLGCTPDGLVGHLGLIEAKCPSSQELYKDIPIYYLPQIVGQIEICNAEWCDFVAWTPTNVAIWRMNGSNKAWGWMYPRLTQMLHFMKNKEKPPRFKKGEKPGPKEFRKLCDYKRVL